MRTLVDLPHEILVMAFDYRIEAGDPTLRSLALTCRVLSDAAMEVLYRVVTLSNKEEVKLFATLMKQPRRRRKMRRSSPLALVRCLSIPPAIDYAKVSVDPQLLASVVDACSNLNVLRTDATVAFNVAESWERGHIRTLILDLPTHSISSDIFTGKLSALERLDIPAIFSTAQSPSHICHLFSASNFPNLRFFSTAVRSHVSNNPPSQPDAFLLNGLRALLALPKIERVVFALKTMSAKMDPWTELVSTLQKFKDSRIYLLMVSLAYEDTRHVDAAKYAWSFTVYHIRDMFLAGVPAISLKPVGTLDRPPKYFDGDLTGSWEF